MKIQPSKMIERVARAIVSAYCDRAVDAPHNDEITEADIEAARAAIAALREPSEAMMKAGSLPYRWTTHEAPPRLELPFGWTTTDAWQAMIDEALKGA
jgi:hypothetical protein